MEKRKICLGEFSVSELLVNVGYKFRVLDEISGLHSVFIFECFDFLYVKMEVEEAECS